MPYTVHTPSLYWQSTRPYTVCTAHTKLPPSLQPRVLQVVSNRLPPTSPPVGGISSPSPVLCPEPLYTAVAKPSGGGAGRSALPNRYLPPQQQQKSDRLRAFGTSPGRPPAVLTRVCCVGGGAKCSQSSGDSSPEPSGRYAAAAAAADTTYRSWRGGTGESGDYWHVEQPGGSSGALSYTSSPLQPPPPSGAAGYERIYPSTHQQQSPPPVAATFQLRPDQPASFSFVGTTAAEQYRRQLPAQPMSLRNDSDRYQAAEALQRPCRGGSVDPPPRSCDDIVKPAPRLGNSVPSSPTSTGGGSSSSRLWGSFRSNKKTPLIEKRQCSPHVKTAS
jgi:hypothetical protein